MLNNIRIVLVNPSHPGNIGSAARAMKTMGITQLYLVDPKQFPHEKAVEMSSKATDILDNAKVFSELRDAIADCSCVIGTSARMRRISWPLCSPREAAIHAMQLQHPAKIACIFGREQSGLTNEELEQCHLHVQIPTDPLFSSLNLAAAVQVIAYEFALAANIETLAETKEFPVANNRDMENFFRHLEEALIALDFLKPDAPRKLMTRLRRFFLRAMPDVMEVNIFRGILAAIETRIQKGNK